MAVQSTNAHIPTAYKAALSLMADRSDGDNDLRMSGLGIAMELCSNP